MDRNLNEQPLRVSIFPYIPDLAGDHLSGLKQYIAQSFEAETGIKVIVESKAEPYALGSLKSKYLSSNSESYDIIELDTILLGELVKSGHVKEIDHTIDNRGGRRDWKRALPPIVTSRRMLDTARPPSR